MLDWLELKASQIYQDSSDDERQESGEEWDGGTGSEEVQTSLHHTSSQSHLKPQTMLRGLTLLYISVLASWEQAEDLEVFCKYVDVWFDLFLMFDIWGNLVCSVCQFWFNIFLNKKYWTSPKIQNIKISPKVSLTTFWNETEIVFQIIPVFVTVSPTAM